MSKNQRIVVLDLASRHMSMAVCSVLEDKTIKVEERVTEEVKDCMKFGQITNNAYVGNAIRKMKTSLESKLNIRITELYIGFGDSSIKTHRIVDFVYTQGTSTNATNEIKQKELDTLAARFADVKLSKDDLMMLTKYPIEYRADNEVVENPLGRYADRLHATYNYITCVQRAIKLINNAVRGLNINIKGYIPNVTVLHLATASDVERKEGAVIIDLGEQLTDVEIVYNDKVWYAISMPTGMNSLDYDIDMFGVPTQYVPIVRANSNYAIAEKAPNESFQYGAGNRRSEVIVRNVALVIQARLTDIFTKINDVVERLSKEKWIPENFAPTIILTGGGSNIKDIAELATTIFTTAVDVRVGSCEYGLDEESVTENMDGHDATLAGIMIYAATLGSCFVEQNREIKRVNSGTRSGGLTVSEDEYAQNNTKTADDANKVGASTTNDNSSSTKPADDKKDGGEVNDIDFGGQDVDKQKDNIFTKIKRIGIELTKSITSSVENDTDINSVIDNDKTGKRDKNIKGGL